MPIRNKDTPLCVYENLTPQSNISDFQQATNLSLFAQFSGCYYFYMFLSRNVNN